MLNSLIVASMVLGATAPAAPVDRGDPDLPFAFYSMIPDVCFAAVRGHTPNAQRAAALQLDQLNTAPEAVRANYPEVSRWYRHRAKPANILVGIDNQTKACHVVLANTMQGATVQTNVDKTLAAGGFRYLKIAPPSAPMSDVQYASRAVDGYVLVSLQAPRATVNGGQGQQAQARVTFVKAAVFESAERVALR